MYSEFLYLFLIFLKLLLPNSTFGSIPPEPEVTSKEIFNSEYVQVQIEKGRRQMDSLIMNSKMPRYGECWISALQNLKLGCQVLSEDVQARLAFSFASCFNEMMGSPPYICTSTTEIKECIQNLDSNGLNTFRDYFLHTQDMCFYLQHQIWQQETNRVVNV